MRKLYPILLAFILSLAMLAATVMPVFAEKPAEPNPNQAVARVDSEINYAASMKPDGHPRHSLTARLFSDGSIAGHLIYGVGQEIGTGFETEWGVFPTGISNFWYDEVNGAAMADIKVFIWMDVPGVYTGPLLYRYQIADYGEPGKKDWVRHWYWMGDEHGGFWVPEFGGEYVPYLHGNAQVHLPTDNPDVTPEPYGWDPSQIPPWFN
jgi:hypothetical protein